MSDCPDCRASEADPRHAGYRSACYGCQVRAMAHSPLFFEAARSGERFAEYRQALIDRQLRHGDVKAAAMRLKGAA